MAEDIICIGCGSILQSTDPKKAGYLPASALKKQKKVKLKKYIVNVASVCVIIMKLCQ